MFYRSLIRRCATAAEASTNATPTADQYLSLSHHLESLVQRRRTLLSKFYSAPIPHPVLRRLKKLDGEYADLMQYVSSTIPLQELVANVRPEVMIEAKHVFHTSVTSTTHAAPSSDKQSFDIGVDSINLCTSLSELEFFISRIVELRDDNASTLKKACEDAVKRHLSAVEAHVDDRDPSLRLADIVSGVMCSGMLLAATGTESTAALFDRWLHKYITHSSRVEEPLSVHVLRVVRSLVCVKRSSAFDYKVPVRIARDLTLQLKRAERSFVPYEIAEIAEVLDAFIEDLLERGQQNPHDEGAILVALEPVPSVWLSLLRHSLRYDPVQRLSCSDVLTLLETSSRVLELRSASSSSSTNKIAAVGLGRISSRLIERLASFTNDEMETVLAMRLATAMARHSTTLRHEHSCEHLRNVLNVVARHRKMESAEEQEKTNDTYKEFISALTEMLMSTAHHAAVVMGPSANSFVDAGRAVLPSRFLRVFHEDLTAALETVQDEEGVMATMTTMRAFYAQQTAIACGVFDDLTVKMIDAWADAVVTARENDVVVTLTTIALIYDLAVAASKEKMVRDAMTVIKTKTAPATSSPTSIDAETVVRDCLVRVLDSGVVSRNHQKQQKSGIGDDDDDQGEGHIVSDKKAFGEELEQRVSEIHRVLTCEG